MEIVHELREAIPDIALSTDVIVGFPGETDEAFGRTLDLVRAVGFDAVYGAAYSPRPRTVSHDWPDDVPTEIKRERLNRLLEVQREISAARNSAWIGRTVEVLVDRHENGRALGRTRQNRTVVLSTQPAPALGTLLEVTITAATTSNLAA
jgi:tRNA-2-methylthio-N6-dimethylallyladenosine synthase